ncbi:hypothetical protein PF005_g6274 [Phytophthora fragariae]|uniref:Tesmin/TSO1-like CXC domain-containing protein n=1 Tax=Phytophthora fragariae TaxID=53985 RepID=A0A6A3YU65_9STRA|nr:hypothetical protein PF011_g12596 [Phytophthora fragariae]KAE9127973.1 hypothetical protein PF010_g4680 [Phytophthora fragariae]KAE9152000.1 hypothetical protein PF006_g3741 [Phytophthora fragariae]KAE9223508.1 hypothetical protein PF005_g6274 [Phytophthora fragariae]KAE9249247.1 hypothetical protein PF002_g5393 [Phytophthora fragariae]
MDTTQDARQSLGGGRDMEEEMQHVLQFLDTSLITPPSGNELVTQHPQMQRSTQPQQLQQRQQQPSPALLREMATLQENEVAGGYNELGEVIDLLGSLDANDTDPALLQQQQVYNVVGAVGLNPATLSRPTAPADVALRRVQLPRSTSVSSSHSGVDNISPVGLLNGPSMSPATINWLQTLVPSTSTESLTGLISPATLYSAGGGSASGIGGVVGGVGSSAQADGAKCGGGDLARTPSCEIIDWKAYNESCADKTQKESAKWRVIPQHGPHAEQAASPNGGNSTGGKLPPGAAASASAAGPTELSAQQQMHLAARKMAEEKSKRKALVSPEYVQYGNTVSLTPSSMPRDPAGGVKMEPGVLQYATKVPEPTGRRPFKKSLHQTTASVIEANSQEPQPQQQPPVSTASSTDGKDDSVRCKCTGKCRNARCACVKAGLVCGAQCKCVSCANPFVPMAREGIDIQLMVRDVCLMQYLSKIKDMQELLDSTVSYECCEGGGGVVQVKHTVENGFACPHCGAHFTYSWCNNRLCPDAKKPRRHCAKCRRCQSSGSATGAKTRAVVPNPVRRDSESTANNDEGDKQNGGQLFGAVNPAVEGAVRDENSDANYSSKPGGEEGADDDSCKMQ